MLRDRSRNHSDQIAGALFYGFALPTSNTTYTPNQFFDVCLPHSSRGVVRLVAYMIRKTLGWCDADGKPIHEVVAFSYGELEHRAGIGHSMIRAALDEAVARGFIRCVRDGQASTRSTAGGTAAYELAWDEEPLYRKDPKIFRGFFAGEGNRTYIPNQFFDELVPNESLATIKVVGSVIRFSIGFVNKYGHRRQQVALSYRDIQRYAKIKSPFVLAKTLREAIAKNYIECVEPGYFDPNAGILSRAAHYAVKWKVLSHESPTTPKSVAAEENGFQHSKKSSGTSPKSVAGGHTEKRSGIQITEINKTLKQQPIDVTKERLQAAGFDARAAEAIAMRYPAERVERQIGWIDQCKIKANRLGMLRAAIDQDWSAPLATTKLGAPNPMPETGLSFEEAIHRAKQRLNNHH